MINFYNIYKLKLTRSVFMNVNQIIALNLNITNPEEFKFLMFANAAHYVVILSPELLSTFHLEHQIFCMGLTHNCADAQHCLFLNNVDISGEFKNQYLSTLLYNFHEEYALHVFNTNLSPININKTIIDDHINNHIINDLIPGFKNQFMIFQKSKLIQLRHLNLFKKNIEF